MLLIGQFDSPFVRRVGIALRFYELPFEHLPWSVFRDAEQIAQFNPLRRVPTLVLDDGTTLVDSTVILDVIDEMATEAGRVRLILERGPERRLALRICAFALGVGDKAVSLVYERALASGVKEGWAERCTGQILDTLSLLERERASIESSRPYFSGHQIGHADIAVTVVLRFLREALPDLWEQAPIPALTALATRCEALPAFQQTTQPFFIARS